MRDFLIHFCSGLLFLSAMGALAAGHPFVAGVVFVAAIKLI